ncbi:MAG: glutamine amidotransferase [Pirellulaceae bacterium]
MPPLDIAVRPCLAQLSVDPLFGWIAVVPLALIMLASLWLTLTSQGISLRARIALMLLRLCAAIVLLLGWLRPGLVTSIERESDGAIAVLMDQSASMTLPSDQSNRNRWEVQYDVWRAIESATDLKIGGSRLVPFFYDQRLSPATTEDLPKLEKTFDVAPVGRLTDLGRTLTEVGQTQIDPPLRGVIMIGDAAQTLVPAEIDATTVARQMAQLDQPIVFIGIGPRGEKGLVKDVALEGMPEYFTAFVKKELSVPLVVHSQGMQNQPIEIKLTLRASGKDDQVVAVRKVLASSPNEKLPLEFKVVLPEAGEYLLVAEAKVDAREQIETNNVAMGFITVREGGVKILYLEGQPRVEQAFLKRSLEESYDFSLEYRWLQEKERRRWPIDIHTSENFEQYDAFIIGDLDAKALSPASLAALARRIQQGAGLLLLGGYHSYDAGGYQATPLRTIIPIEMKRPPQRWDAPIDESHHIRGNVYLIPKRSHPAINLETEPDNTRLWRNLKPLQGMNRFGAISRSLGTQVLLESQDGDPVLVAGEAGKGRVLAFAGDTTYQWFLAGESSGQKRAHQQFWRQSLLWLIRRDSLNHGFRLGLDRRRLEIDATPKLSIDWFGGSENRPMPEQVKIEVSREGQWLQNVETNAISETTREARITGLSQPGLYRAALTSKDVQGETYTTDIAFIVRDESRELSQLAADWQMMNNIVAANDASGGKLYLPEDVGAVVRWFRDRQDATKVTTIERRRLGDAAWDAWLTLAAFCIVMSIEWALRKSWQLP